MKKGFMAIAASCVLAALLLCGCSKNEQGLQDGYYTARAANYNFGWKEYVTILVKDGEIVSTEYNAENASGFIKSWDNAYMKNMLPVSGTYPNEYTRNYAAQLTGTDGNVKIDGLSGATSSQVLFQQLVDAVIVQAKNGDSSVAEVVNGNAE